MTRLVERVIRKHVFMFFPVVSREKLGSTDSDTRAVEGHARLPVSLMAGTLKLIDLAAAVTL